MTSPSGSIGALQKVGLSIDSNIVLFIGEQINIRGEAV